MSSVGLVRALARLFAAQQLWLRADRLAGPVPQPTVQASPGLTKKKTGLLAMGARKMLPGRDSERPRRRSTAVGGRPR
jgi:hypothetical protein